MNIYLQPNEVWDFFVDNFEDLIDEPIVIAKGDSVKAYLSNEEGLPLIRMESVKEVNALDKADCEKAVQIIYDAMS